METCGSVIRGGVSIVAADGLVLKNADLVSIIPELYFVENGCF